MQNLMISTLFALAWGTAAAAPVAPVADWRLHDPIVIDSGEAPAEVRRKALWMAPMGFAWVDGQAHLASVRGAKHTPVTDIWREGADRAWRRVASRCSRRWWRCPAASASSPPPATTRAAATAT
jgi:hypothetical protein